MGLFISFEGPEGSGKSTQIELLNEYLTRQGQKVLVTRQPGGTRIGKKIREIILNPEHPELCSIAETLLFNADRSQHVDEIINPALNSGNIVITDRYADSTIAYQHYGRGMSLLDLKNLEAFAIGACKPNLTFLLDIDPRSGLSRKQSGNREEWNRMEEQSLTLHQRVHQGYLTMANEKPQRWRVINADRPVLHVQHQILQNVRPRLHTNY